jgi:hypothetical protein
MGKQLQLVTYEQAKRLKELGFDWTHSDSGCKWYYPEPDGNIMILDVSFTDKSVAAPTVALALKWIRDEKGKIFTVKWDYLGGGDYNYYYIIEYKNSIPIVGFGTKDYYIVESQLLDKLLTILEKKKEQ